MKFNWVRSVFTPKRLLFGLLPLLCFQSASFSVDLATGQKFGGLVDDTGNLFTWGANASGQLGNDTIVDANSPVLPPEAGPWSAIATSITTSSNSGYEGHTLAIKDNGTLWAWGANADGQLGDGTTIDRLTPKQIGSATNWVDVEAGGGFSMALNALGEVYVWGQNSLGQLGGASSLANVKAPIKLDSNVYIAIAAGYEHALAIRSHSGAPGFSYGNIYGWGQNYNGQLGLGHDDPVTGIQKMGTGLWYSVDAGVHSSFAISTTSSAAYSWGKGEFGSLGLGMTGPTVINESESPALILMQSGSNTGWTAVSVGAAQTLLLKSNGTVYGAGYGPNVGLGTGSYSKFKYISLPSLAVAIGAGNTFSAVVLDDGKMLTSGSNDRGQLANGTTGGSSSTFTNSLLGQPDLEVTGVTISTLDPTPGSTMEGTIFLANNGSGAITDSYDLEAVLSPSTDFDDADAIPLVFTGVGSALTITDDLAPGGSDSIAFEVDLDAVIPAGTYYMIVRADSAGVLDEATTDNNTKESATTIDFTADLIIDSITVSADDPGTGAVESFPISPGSVVQIEVVIENQGKGSIPAGVSDAFDFRLFLSMTQNVDAIGAVDLVTDLEITDGVAGNGGTVTLTYTGVDALTLPINLSIGDYYVGAVADVNEDIDEVDELNNSLFTATPIVEVSGIELEEALDTVLFTDPIDFVFVTSSDPIGLQTWFGQDVETFDSVDAAKSPLLSAGQSATFAQDGFTDIAVKVTFRWKAATSSPENYLYFGINGQEIDAANSRIAGDQDWTEVTHIVPPNSQLTWTYVQGAAGEGDAVYVDTISVVELTEPDLIVNTISGEEGTYVLGSDNLTLSILTYNQGADTSLASGIPFEIGVYLSLDAAFNPGADILVESLSINQVFYGGDSSLYIPNITLSETIPADNYYLIVVVDKDNTVAEEPGGGEDNNVFVTETASVEILALPDIRVSQLQPTIGYYLVGEELDFNFSITNEGLGNVNDPFDIQVVLSTDSVADTGDYSITEFERNIALPVGAVQSITPDFYQIPNDVPLGQRLYFGVIVDTGDAIEEENELNNKTTFPGRNFIFSELSVEEGFELTGIADVDPFVAPFEGDLPWYGQTAINIDNEDAIASVDIENGETAAFNITINATTDTFVTFQWKVSSENEPDQGRIDSLNFYVDDMANPVKSIAGEIDWQRVSVFVTAGTHDLRWAYEKDAQGSDGADRGWLDLFSFEVPDLVVDPINFTAGSFVPGSTIPDFAFDVTNTGVANVPQSPPFTISIVASPDTTFGNAGDNVLATYVDSDGLLATESRAYLTDLVLPASLPEGNYYIGVKVDSAELIPESSELNNTSFSSSTVLSVVPPISLNAAIDDPDADLVTELPLTIGGEQGWFALADAPLEDGSSTTSDGVDAAQSGPIASGQESYFQTIIQGPKELKFRWKIDSTPSSNFVKFTMNDLVINQISGKVDWDFGFGSFTLTYNGETTDQIASGATDVELAAALNALSSITSAGGVTVTSTGPLDYEITFVATGNKNPISFTAISPLKVATSTVMAVNGSTGTNEVQTIAIVPNVTFRLNYDGVNTAPLPYTASATDVQVAINALSSIVAESTSVTVTGSDLDFEITFDDPGLREAITVDISGLGQPGTIDDDITTVGDGGTPQVQELRVGPEITVFIPAGTQELRWTYAKNTTGEGTIDAAWVDQVEFTDVTVPDLALTGVNYTPGEYILDIIGIAGAPEQFLGTEYLDVTVEAENQGVDYTGPVFSTADLEVRLSTDRIYGNGDDIVLGTVSQVEGTLEAGDLMRFLGPIQLGDSVPEDFYYLMARVDTNEQVEEYDEDNNTWIGENRDIQITRLPALRIYNPDADVLVEGTDGEFNFLDPREGVDVAFDLDEGMNYYTETPMRLRFSIQNIGLDRIEGNEVWSTQVTLRGGLREDIDDALDASEIIDAMDITIDLGDFTIEELMEGRSEAKPEGDIIEVDIELALPNGGKFNDIIANDKSIVDYLWMIQIDLDSNDEIPESQIIRESPSLAVPSGLPWWIINLGEAGAADVMTTYNTDDNEGLFGIYPQPETFTFLEWQTLYAAGASTDEFFAYAFNRNPSDTDTVGSQFPGTYGVTEVEGDEYLSIAFDIVTRATDLGLGYIVQASDDPGFPDTLAAPTDELVVILPPFDELTGPASLTGDGGLVDEDNVLSVLDQGYSARVTVKDVVTVGSVPARFIRVVVDTSDTTVVPDP